jgi:hypothetical protein
MVAGFVGAVVLAAPVALGDGVLVAGSVPVSGVSAQPVRSSGLTSSAVTTAIAVPER